MKLSQTWIAENLPPIIRDGMEYFLLSRDGQLYLVENKCPHRGGPLKLGFVDECDRIVCPWHRNAISIDDLIARSSTLKLETNH